MPRHIPPRSRIWMPGSDPETCSCHIGCAEQQVMAPALRCASSGGSRSICHPTLGAGVSPHEGSLYHVSHRVPPACGICRHRGDLPPARLGGEKGNLSVKDLDSSARLTAWCQPMAKGFLVLLEPFPCLGRSSLCTGGRTQGAAENGK